MVFVQNKVYFPHDKGSYWSFIIVLYLELGSNEFYIIYDLLNEICGGGNLREGVSLALIRIQIDFQTNITLYRFAPYSSAASSTARYLVLPCKRSFLSIRCNRFLIHI